MTELKGWKLLGTYRNIWCYNQPCQQLAQCYYCNASHALCLLVMYVYQETLPVCNISSHRLRPRYTRSNITKPHNPIRVRTKTSLYWLPLCLPTNTSNSSSHPCTKSKSCLSVETHFSNVTRKHRPSPKGSIASTMTFKRHIHFLHSSLVNRILLNIKTL